jgi:fermentation-respiration switch protein FrsA (DUF1100 family)
LSVAPIFQAEEGKRDHPRDLLIGAVIRETALILLATALVGLSAIWLFQRHLIYFPVSAVPSVDATLPGARIVDITTEDGLILTGWFVTAATPKAAVLVLNGNAGNRAHRAPLATGLVEQGYAVLLFDYRGYGGQAGTPSEKGLMMDAAAASRALVQLSDSDHLVLFGESLGSAVAAHLALQTAPDALVLRSPFPSLAAVAAVHYPYLPAGMLLRDDYDTNSAVSTLEVPILVVAGEADSIVPSRLSQQVHDAAPAGARWVLIENAGHNDTDLSFGTPLLDAIDRFLDEVLATNTGG